MGIYNANTIYKQGNENKVIFENITSKLNIVEPKIDENSIQLYVDKKNSLLDFYFGAHFSSTLNYPNRTLIATFDNNGYFDERVFVTIKIFTNEQSPKCAKVDFVVNDSVYTTNGIYLSTFSTIPAAWFTSAGRYISKLGS